MRWILPLVVVCVVLGLLLRGLLGTAPPSLCARRVKPASEPRFAKVVSRTPATLHVRYDDGFEVDLPRDPQRIVSGLPGITEMIAHVGALSRLVAVSPHCDRPAIVQGLPKVSVLPLSVEGLLAAKPDLVVLDRRLHRAGLAEVLRHVPHVLLLETSRSLAHLDESQRLLAEVLDNDLAREAAAQWSEGRHTLVEALRREHFEPPPRVLVVAGWDPLFALGPGALMDDVLAVMGCANVACDLPGDASGTLSEELVLLRRPDWIFDLTGLTPARIEEAWRDLPALQNDQLLRLSNDVFQRGGPRMLDVLEGLAERVVGYKPPGGSRRTATPDDADADQASGRR